MMELPQARRGRSHGNSSAYPGAEVLGWGLWLLKLWGEVQSAQRLHKGCPSAQRALQYFWDGIFGCLS